jgi:thiol:disulfide interchange protein
MRGGTNCLVWVTGLAVLSFVLYISGCAEQETSTYSGSPAVYQSDVGAETPAKTTGGSKFVTSVDLNKLGQQSQQENKPVYIEFTADWCGYCQKYARETLDTTEGQNILKKVIFVQANYDTNRSLANQHGFTGIPAGILMKADANGKLQLVDKHVGGMTASELDNFLNQACK